MPAGQHSAQQLLCQGGPAMPPQAVLLCVCVGSTTAMASTPVDLWSSRTHSSSARALCCPFAVVKKGRIVEQGTHQALLEAGGTYATLVALQQAEGGDEGAGGGAEGLQQQQEEKGGSESGSGSEVGGSTGWEAATGSGQGQLSFRWALLIRFTSRPKCSLQASSSVHEPPRPAPAEKAAAAAAGGKPGAVVAVGEKAVQLAQVVVLAEGAVLDPGAAKPLAPLEVQVGAAFPSCCSWVLFMTGP